MQYLVNEAGDVYARRLSEGTEELVDPSAWRWAARKRHVVAPDRRRTIDQLRGLPGFTVKVADGPKFVPGPRTRAAQWMAWAPGSAPPAAATSKGGEDGTLGYFDRLSAALGHVVARLPSDPERSPFVVHDFVSGRRIEIVYTPPPVGPGGEGVVYVLDDGDGFKIGHTVGPPAKRIAGLQIGNPRVIRTVATIAAANPAVEAHLHKALSRWNRRGEWFERGPLLEKVNEAGGWRAYLTSVLPQGDWSITTHDGDGR